MCLNISKAHIHLVLDHLIRGYGILEAGLKLRDAYNAARSPTYLWSEANAIGVRHMHATKHCRLVTMVL